MKIGRETKPEEWKLGFSLDQRGDSSSCCFDTRRGQNFRASTRRRNRQEKKREFERGGRNLSVLICCRDRGIEAGAFSRSPVPLLLPATPPPSSLPPPSPSHFLRVPFRIRNDSLSIRKKDRRGRGEGEKLAGNIF